MNFKKLLSLISGLSLPVTMLTTTISCTNKSNDSLEVDFGINGAIIKTANYILDDKIDPGYVMSYMEGLFNAAPKGIAPVDLNSFLDMKPIRLHQISLNDGEDPTVLFSDTDKFDNADLNLYDTSDLTWYGVASEIARIKYTTNKENEIELIIRLRDGTHKKWDDIDKSTAGKIAKWHDGVTVKAQDFVFTFESILNLENTSKQLQKIKDTKIADVEKIQQAQIKDKKSFEEAMENHNLGIKALSDNILYLKFEISGNAPTNCDGIIKMVSNIFFIPTRKDFIKKIGNGSIKEGLKNFGTSKSTIIGNGAFFPWFVMFDYETIFKKSDHYWDKERIPANCYKWKVVKDATTLGVLFKNKQISQAYKISKDIYDEIRKDPNSKKYTYQGLDNDPFGTFISINFNSKNPETKKIFQNIHLRRALAAAINRTDVIVAQGDDGTFPAETSSSLAYRISDENGVVYKDWLVDDDGKAKYNLNFCEQQDKNYQIPLATKKFKQQLFYEKSDLQIDYTDKLHNLKVVEYELKKFKTSVNLKKPIEINFLYNSTFGKNRNTVEMIEQQLSKFIKKDIIKINLIGKEECSFIELFKKGDYDLILTENSITKSFASGNWNTIFIFEIFSVLTEPSKDNHYKNVTGTWSLWEEVISKDPFIKNNSDDGSGWATKILDTIGLKLENGKKLTKDIFMSNDDIEILKWYFAKTEDGKSWFKDGMEQNLYNELVSTYSSKLDQDVFKKYFVDYSKINESKVTFKKVKEAWKDDGKLVLQFRAARILEVLLRYYQPIINLTSANCSYDACDAVGFTYTPFHGFKYSYNDDMMSKGKLKNFKYKLPKDCYFHSDMYKPRKEEK